MYLNSSGGKLGEESKEVEEKSEKVSESEDRIIGSLDLLVMDSRGTCAFDRRERI